MKLIPENAAEIWSYDPTTGLLKWLVRGGHGIVPGDLAGCIKREGYVIVSYGYQKYRAHRIAWFLMTEMQPPPILDHINRNKSDNRWGNLRAVTARLNSLNATKKVQVRTHCPRGHRYDYIRPNGWRDCKECRRLAVHAWRQRHISQTPNPTKGGTL